MKNILFRLLGVNLFSSLLGVITSFLLPKYLSINSYGYIKTFQFYLMYVGLLHLGYIDGIYLKYGGKNIRDINNKSITEEIINFLYLEIGICLLMSIFVFVKKDFLFFCVVLSIIPYNFITYVRMLFQASGEFKKYSKILFLNAVLLFAINMILIVLKKNYLYFILLYCILYYFLMCFSFLLIRKKMTKVGWKVNFNVIRSIIISGAPLMLGNFAGVMYTGMDRWAIRLYFDTASFAFYSFAVSVMNIIETFLSPITMTLYNFFATNNNRDLHRDIKTKLIILSYGVMSGIFIIKKIIEIFIPKYQESIVICFILAIAYVYMVVIRGIYVNLYKVEKKQKTYMLKMLLALFSGFILNCIATFTFHTNASIAICTIFGVLLWEQLCLKDFSYLRSSGGEVIYKIILTFSFFFLGIYTSAEKGILIYLFIYLGMSLLIYRKILVFKK